MNKETVAELTSLIEELRDKMRGGVPSESSSTLDKMEVLLEKEEKSRPHTNGRLVSMTEICGVTTMSFVLDNEDFETLIVTFVFSDNNPAIQSISNQDDSFWLTVFDRDGFLRVFGNIDQSDLWLYEPKIVQIPNHLLDCVRWE
jgi:hypothetical protein